MPALTGDVIITQLGEQAMLAGTLEIETVRLGDGIYTPTDAMTGLQNEISSAAASGVVVPDPGGGWTLRINALDQSGWAYDLHEFSLADDQGRALFIYSQATIIDTKGAGSTLTFAINIRIDNAAAGSITITGATNYFLPFADEVDAGIVELATTAEARAGTATQQAVTPFGLAAAGLKSGRLTAQSDIATDAAAVETIASAGNIWALVEKHEATDGRFVRSYVRVGGSSPDNVVWCRTINAKADLAWSKDNAAYAASRTIMAMQATAAAAPAILNQWVNNATDAWTEDGWQDGVSIDNGRGSQANLARLYGRIYKDAVPIVDSLISLGPTPQHVSGGQLAAVPGYTFAGLVCELTLFGGANGLPDYTKAKVYPAIQSSIAGAQIVMGDAASNTTVQFSIYDIQLASLVQLDAAGASNIQVAVRVTCGE